MKRWLGFSVGLLMATAVQATEDWSTWTIQSKSRDESEVADVELYYLINENQHYRLAKFGAKTDPRFELIGVNQASRTLWLLAHPFESLTAIQRPASRYRCSSVAEPQGRKNFYSICNSRFALQHGEVTEVDIEKLRRALDDANFLALMGDARLAQYHADFANAKAASSLKRFIERYRDDDPEGLVEQARRKIPGQELEDYRSAFRSAMNTPLILDKDLSDPGLFRKDALRRFIDKYRSRDPEALTAKANLELLRLLAEEERQRQRYFEAVGELGSTICLELQTEPSLLMDEKRWQEARIAQIVGTTEQATSTKLKVFIHQITIWKSYDFHQHVPVAGVKVDGLPVNVGGYSWFDRNGWRPCKAK